MRAPGNTRLAEIEAKRQGALTWPRSACVRMRKQNRVSPSVLQCESGKAVLHTANDDGDESSVIGQTQPQRVPFADSDSVSLFCG
jgi:hypothetical protein